MKNDNKGMSVCVGDNISVGGWEQQVGWDVGVVAGGRHGGGRDRGGRGSRAVI